MRDASIVREWESGNNKVDIIFSRHASYLSSESCVLHLKNANLSKLRKNCFLDVLFRAKVSTTRPLPEGSDFGEAGRDKVWKIGIPACLGRWASYPVEDNHGDKLEACRPSHAGSLTSEARFYSHKQELQDGYPNRRRKGAAAKIAPPTIAGNRCRPSEARGRLRRASPYQRNFRGMH